MAWNIVLLIILVLGIGVVVWLALKKLPEIRVVDPSTSKEAKAKELKYALLRQRIERIGGERAASLTRSVLRPLGSGMQGAVRSIAGKLTAIERKYAQRQKGGGEKLHNPEVLRALIREAASLVDNEEYDAAEKKLIEVVSHDPKNVPAYEHLGRLYFVTKDYAGARETFQFLAKLSPRDASVLAALGEVAEVEGRLDDARKQYKEALALSPNNPKYLDFYIGAVIACGDVHEATVALDHLREVNPDNQKIAEFDVRIGDLRNERRG